MRLRLLNENVSRQDFFDFYTLLNAWQTRAYPIVNHFQVEHRLEEVTFRIAKDHLNQLADMVINRVSNSDKPDVIAALQHHGLSYDKENFQIRGLDRIDFPTKAAYLEEIKDFEPFGFTGDTWRGLLNFVRTAKVPADLNKAVVLVDQIYGLCHHGGQITDYMDERDWLEDALHFRDGANLKQLARHASGEIRNLIGRSSLLGLDGSEVTDLQKLYVALRRVLADSDTLTVAMRDGVVTVTGVVLVYMLGDIRWQLGHRHKRIEYLNDLASRMKGQLTSSERQFFAQITQEGDTLHISDGRKTATVEMPINRHRSLACDIINSVGFDKLETLGNEYPRKYRDLLQDRVPRPRGTPMQVSVPNVFR